MLIKICSVIAFSVTVPIITLAQYQSIDDSVQKLISNGRTDNAIILLEGILKQQPDSPKFHRLLGLIYHNIKNYDKAIDAYLKAADMADCDTCFEDYDSVTVICLEKQDYDAGIKYAQKALEHGSPTGKNNIKSIYILKGDDELNKNIFEKALSQYQKSLNISEDTLSYQRILLCYSYLDEKEKLLKLSEKLLKEFPAFKSPTKYLCSFYYETAMLLVPKGDYKTAIELFNQCIEFDPSRFNEIAFEIGNSYLALKDTAQALQYYSNALMDTLISCEAAILISDIYIKRNQNELALRTLQNVLNIFPPSSTAWEKISKIYLLLGKREESIECDKISAKLGNKVSQDRLRNNYIPYDTVDLNSLLWFTEDPFASKWRDNSLYEDRLSPSEYVPIDTGPIPKKHVPPDYPLEARRAGLEGTVWLKVLVGKLGKIRRAIILKSDAEIFNSATIAAAMQWEFTPAKLNGKPIEVWAAIPFKFRLNR